MFRPRGESQKEVMELRERLQTSRRTRSRFAGFILLGISLASLVLTLQTGHLVFEITFLLSLFVGSLVLFYEVEKNVGVGAANAVLISSLLDLSYFVDTLELEHGITFAPDPADINNVRVNVNLTTQHDTIRMPEFSSPLTHIYELRMGDLANLDLPYLFRNLPKIIVDGLQLAQSAEISMNGSQIEAVLRKPTFSEIYLEGRLRRLNEKIGCPLACSIGESIAKCSKKKVAYAGYDYSNSEDVVRFKYILGPE